MGLGNIVSLMHGKQQSVFPSPQAVCLFFLVMVFAWGAAYSSMSGESEGSNDDHLIYYNQARLFLGDVIDIFPPGLDVIACLLLVSLYLLMTHKPYRYSPTPNVG